MKRHTPQECILIGQPPSISHYTMCLTSVQHMEPSINLSGISLVERQTLLMDVLLLYRKMKANF